MPKFVPRDPTTEPNPQAKPLAPTVETTATILQRELVAPQRSFTSPYGDTRRDFPRAVGSPETWPSTAVTPPVMTQPTDPKVGPITPRKLR